MTRCTYNSGKWPPSTINRVCPTPTPFSFRTQDRSTFDFSIPAKQFRISTQVSSRREYHVNASQPDLARHCTIYGETGNLTAVHKNVYISAAPVISRGGPRYGDARNEAFLSFLFVSNLGHIFPLLATAVSGFTARINFTPDLAPAGTGGEGYFQTVPGRLLCRLRPSRFRFSRTIPSLGGIYRTAVPTHHLKTRKQESSCPRVSISNVVEKYLLQG